MAFVFKIKIKGSAKPPIWRKVKVNESMDFYGFHLVIQILFGWTDSHMFMFSPKGWGNRPEISIDYEDEFGDFEEYSDEASFPHGERYRAYEIKLSDYFHKPKQKIIYIYDFGDDWQHIIELVEITDEKVMYPICLGGKGCNLEEDCGGIGGFYYMVEAINNPQHPEHEEYCESMDMESGEKWDINKFDLEEINEALKRIYRILCNGKHNRIPVYIY